jgi:hypothetical protein
LPIWLAATWFLVQPRWEALSDGRYAVRDDKPIANGNWFGFFEFDSAQDCESKRKDLVRPEQRRVAASEEEAAEISLNKSRCVAAAVAGSVEEPASSVAPGTK